MMEWDESFGPFYKANFHTHTTVSDGKKSPSEAVDFYRNEGYDIVAITDHRTVTDLPGDSNGLLLLRGIEYDHMLPGQAIHLVGIGIDKSIERIWNPAMTPQQTVKLICSHGGATILAHPGWSLNDPATIAELKDIDAVEIWNSVSAPPYNPNRADSSLLLDSLWSNYPGTLLPVMANDDTHFYGSEFARGWTMIRVEELSEQFVIKALQAGQFYASCGPEIRAFEMRGNRVRIACSPCSQIIFYSNTPWASNRCLDGEGLTEAFIELEDSDRFLRAQVIDSKGHSAWTSPIPVKRVQG